MPAPKRNAQQLISNYQVTILLEQGGTTHHTPAHVFPLRPYRFAIAIEAHRVCRSLLVEHGKALTLRRSVPGSQ